MLRLDPSITEDYSVVVRNHITTTGGLEERIATGQEIDTLYLEHKDNAGEKLRDDEASLLKELHDGLV